MPVLWNPQMVDRAFGDDFFEQNRSWDDFGMILSGILGRRISIKPGSKPTRHWDKKGPLGFDNAEYGSDEAG